jgi:hypothetical protein
MLYGPGNRHFRRFAGSSTPGRTRHLPCGGPTLLEPASSTQPDTWSPVARFEGRRSRLRRSRQSAAALEPQGLGRAYGRLGEGAEAQ